MRLAIERRVWWVAAVNGVVTILFGLAALLWPGLTLFLLISLFGAYASIFGLVHFVAMARALGEGATWWQHLVLGLISVGAGIVAFAYPGMTALVLLYIIAFWAITTGVIDLVAAFSLRELWLGVAGAVSIVFGFLLLANPMAGALAYVMVIGIFAILRGVALLIHAMRTPTPSPV